MMRRTLFGLLLAGSMAIGFSGCDKDKDKEPQACNFDPCAFKAPAAEIQRVKDYLASKNITATEHCSGLFYTIENAGTGKTPKACDDVAARYKGMLTDGSVFDQSATPIPFNLQGVIGGWTIGVPLVKEGGRIILYLPPSLGYGNQEVRDPRTGALKIPANSILVFEVDLDKVD